MHIPWDKVEDYGALKNYAADLGVALGTINSNTFQDDLYKFGSLTTSDDAVRRKAIDHHFECIEIMNQTGSRDLKIWLADGTNYAGQGDIPGTSRPARRQPRTDLRPDRAGAAAGVGIQVLRTCLLPHRRARLGHLVRPRCRIGRPSRGLSGHGSPRARHQHRVHRRSAVCGSGSWARLTSTLATTPTTISIVGSADPFQLFRILYEVVRGGGYGPDSDVAFMLDQCHNIEAKIPGQIRSVLNVQEMTARALLVDRDALGGCAGSQ